MTKDPLINALPETFLAKLRARAFAEDTLERFRALTPTQSSRLLARCMGMTLIDLAALEGVDQGTASDAVQRACAKLDTSNMTEAAYVLEKAGVLDVRKRADGSWRVVLNDTMALAVFSGSRCNAVQRGATCNRVAGNFATQRGSV